jgi:hypothetical protein
MKPSNITCDKIAEILLLKKVVQTVNTKFSRIYRIISFSKKLSCENTALEIKNSVLCDIPT